MNRSFQVKARIWAAILLVMLGLWILHSFLVPMVWAVVLGLTTWPLYDGLKGKQYQGERSGVMPAMIITLGIAVLIFGPVTYGLLRLGHELQSIMRLLQHAHQSGILTPDWLLKLPGIGTYAANAWGRWLGTSEAFNDLLKHILASDIPAYTRSFATQILHRYTSAFFTLVVLFFVYQNGRLVSERVLLLCDQTFGEKGGRYARHAASAVRATVSGIVLVAIGQGVLLGLGYGVAGFEHATLLGVCTGLIALIPFAAKIVVLGASVVLFAEGSVGAGVGLVIFGLVVVLVTDNYIKPKLIGSAVSLPFIWTLFGILGGIETFGFLGLFLGPTIMAILISVWRDSVAELEVTPL